MAVLNSDIYIGSTSQPFYHFTNRSIVNDSLEGVFAVDIIGDTLSVDTFSFIVKHLYDRPLIYAPSGKDGYLDTNDKLYRLQASGVKQYVDFIPRKSDALIDDNDKQFRAYAGYTAGDYLKDLPYGTPVYWYITNSFYTKGYIKSVDRVSKYGWQVTCVSGVGLLESRMHSGGIYTGQTLLSIAQSIIGGTFSYTSDPAVSSIKVYGHLPYDTARNNLHRLLFSAGAALTKGTASNDYIIRFLPSATVNVPDSRIAIGGSINTELPANRVEITEHAFAQLQSDVEEVLYDNTASSPADNTRVVFDRPVYGLTATENLTIVESSVNYAVLSGIGTLSGKPYTHMQTVVALQNGGADGQIRVKRVTDNELVSAVNSRNVARRVLSYYGNGRTVKAKITLKGEKTGNNLSMFNPYGEASNALLSKMTVLVTSIIGANCELIEGYEPKDNGNTYSQREMFTASGTFTVPAGVKDLMIVLIGGGQGGQGGYNGQNGHGDSNEISQFTSGSTRGWKFNTTQVAALGGAGGVAGEAGKVFVKELTVNAGMQISITVGVGGAGGAVGGGLGALGTASTANGTGIGLLTSEDGLVTSGYFDVIAQTTYAIAGLDGQAGADGGMSDKGSAVGHYGQAGQRGGSVATWRGGAGGAGYIRGTSGRDTYYRASGGGGGGAAMGASGGAGGDGTNQGSDVYGGDGGAGANAVVPEQPSYGNGGTGGNGGGAGGNAGLAQTYFDIVSPTSGFYAGTPGVGGSGSVGSAGGNGCVIIYY